MVPIIDLERYLNGGARAAKDDIQQLAEASEQLGVVYVRDPRLPEGLDQQFRDMMTRLFRLPRDLKISYSRPDLSHQLGWTPAFVERARDHRGLLKQIHPKHQPLLFDGADPKERWFEQPPRAEQPRLTRYQGLNEPAIVPGEFPEWSEIMASWRCVMLDAVVSYLEMLALAFGGPKHLFVHKLRRAPHLIAPTGMRLNPLHKAWRRAGIAKFHYDLNLVTIHGKASFPGLYAWTRGWERFPVRVPDGCLLIQNGWQLWYLTGGRLLYGFHEVVYDPDQHATVVADLVASGDRDPWRVTTTLFAHVASDQYLYPLGPFATPENLASFPRMTAGRQVREEIRAIGLSHAL